MKNNKNKSLNKEDVRREYFKLCEQGDVEKVKSIMPYVKDNFSQGEIEMGFCNATTFGHLELMKYFIENKDLNITANAMDDFVFNHVASGDNEDILEYLIFKCDVVKTKKIEDYMNKYDCVFAESLFKVRDVMKKEGKSLEDYSKEDTVKTVKPKI